jgi:hypothetical protein
MESVRKTLLHAAPQIIEEARPEKDRTGVPKPGVFGTGGIIQPAMIYTYCYEVMCAGKDCNQFISLSSYTTTVRGGLQDLDLGDRAPRKCLKCGFRHGYHPPDHVYSQRPDGYVPLDQ